MKDYEGGYNNEDDFKTPERYFEVTMTFTVHVTGQDTLEAEDKAYEFLDNTSAWDITFSKVEVNEE